MACTCTVYFGAFILCVGPKRYLTTVVANLKLIQLCNINKGITELFAVILAIRHPVLR